jgi:chromosome segregation ATPase
MAAKFLTLLLVLGYSYIGVAEDLMDVSTDVEEIMSDSEAAKAQAKAAKVRAEIEKRENAKAMQETIKARSVAEQKRRDAQGELKRTETQIKMLQDQSVKYKEEMKKIDNDTAVALKVTDDAKAKLEKLKRDITTAQELKAEKVAKLTEANKQRDEILKALHETERQHAAAQADFKKISEDEKIATQNLEKATVEDTQKKNKLTAEIAQLKARYRQSKTVIEALNKETTNMHESVYKLDQQLKVARAETKAVETEEAKRTEQPTLKDPIEEANRAPAATPDQMTLKKDCNMREAPDRNAKFLGVKRSGQSVSKSDEVDGWIATPVQGRTAYLMKNCF